MVITLALLAANAINLVRQDAAQSNVYLSEVRAMADAAASLPDTNGDGEIILMTQDPYILRYVGLRSVMFPYEDRDTIFEVARRYHVDYLLMPPNRPSLNALAAGAETDPRFVHTRNVPGTNFVFFAVRGDA
ncbi:MAG: hypothetical protein HC828_22225 [Blastochloris sp.]|nr:hypothetical protein [Blastochloris sp.]